MAEPDWYASRSHAGLVRSGNEDRALTRPPLFAVADGMGGHRAGEVASELAVSLLAASVERDPAPDGDAIVQAITESNAAIRREARSRPELVGMGTTCTVALVDPEIRIAHVGDSRVYLLRDGQLRQLTTDHSLVAQMVGEGIVAPDAAEARDVRHIITRALGADDDVQVDVVTADRRPGDRLLLCTDGLHGQVDDEAIGRILAEPAGPADAADRLIAAANEAGGEDNVTVIVVDLDRGLPAATARPSGSRLQIRLPAWIRGRRPG
ncbi:MAG: Stp1/IreP family PP2C-type Ser/Thr phosphatase [Chloroflexi bacterium]|nr:Stp1/IreP family PP2C-type Ser/Thr phosphatase [Chloroflexota bacterium]